MSITLLNQSLTSGSTVDLAPLMGCLLSKDIVQCHIDGNTVAVLISFLTRTNVVFSVWPSAISRCGTQFPFSLLRLPDVALARADII